MPTPQVLLGAEARAQLKNGLDLLAQVISLTLGPRAGGVALSRIAKGPEVLTSSAVIARRIVEIPGRGANVGAMLLRNAVCRVNDQLGDGGATTAALAHALLAGGYRQLAAGANPMLLRRGMECGLRATVAALQAQARPLGGERDLACLAHQFFEGAIWAGGFVSPAFVTDQARQQTPLTEPRMLVTDYTISEPAQIVRLLEQIVQLRSGPLLILAEDVTGAARALLLSNRARGVLDVVAATLTIQGSHRRHNLEDIAILTDAYFVTQGQGDRLESVGIGDLGRARLVQVGAEKIAIVGGAG